MAALYKVVSGAGRRGTCLFTRPELFPGSRFYSSRDEGVSAAEGDEKQRSGFAAAYELHSELKQQQDTKVRFLLFYYYSNFNQ